jgi:hypothetical protein
MLMPLVALLVLVLVLCHVTGAVAVTVARTFVLVAVLGFRIAAACLVRDNVAGKLVQRMGRCTGLGRVVGVSVSVWSLHLVFVVLVLRGVRRSGQVVDFGGLPLPLLMAV